MSNRPSPTRHHARRLRAEKRFRAMALGAACLAGLILVVLLGDIFARGVPGFFQAQIRATLHADPTLLGAASAEEAASVPGIGYRALAGESAAAAAGWKP